MKKLLFTCCILFSAALVFAQDDQAKPAATTPPATPQATTPQAAPKTTTAPATKQSKATVTHKVAVKNYCCPDCDYVSTKPGTCPHHSKALIRDGMYYCTDGSTSREPGVCKDGTAMIKMVDKSKKATEIKTAPQNK